MKKLLLQFDTDSYASVFDSVVGYDGGADHVLGYANVTPDNVNTLVEGAIFTRAPKNKKNTVIFVGGSDLHAGQLVFDSVLSSYFSNYRVSVMLDSNGCNTTAAAGVATITTTNSVAGKNAVILAGTGPVGQRAAVMLSKQGANVFLTSRTMEKAMESCNAMYEQFGTQLNPVQAATNKQRSESIKNAHIVFACGAAGINLLDEDDWSSVSSIEILVDANPTPSLGIQGIEMMDKGVLRHNKICWGAIGFGNFKLALHRNCIERLFEDNTTVLDAEQIYSIASQLRKNS